MTIQLDKWKVQNCSFTALSGDEIREDNSFDLKTGHFFPDADDRVFGIGFEVEIKDKEFDLFVEAIYMFKVDESINEEFKLSNFPRINAPAIAFPFLRAYISNLTLQSGYDPVVLPSINFVQLAEEREDDLD